MLTPNQRLMIFRLRDGLVSAQDIERWIYSETRLEDTLGNDAYLELISLDYRTNGAIHETLKILKPYYSEAEYLEWNLKEVLQAIITRSEGVHAQIARTYDLYCKGYDFLRKIGLEYGLEITAGVPWEQMSADTQHDLIERFYPTINDDAQRVLACVNTKTIEITGWGEFGLEYRDNRTAKEKKLMGVRGLNMDNLCVRLMWKWFKIPIYTYS